MGIMNRVFKICRNISQVRLSGLSNRQITTSQNLFKYIDEPEYIKYTKPQVPVYDLLNIQMKCYDFTVLEHYAKYVHKIALNMEFIINDAWATPHQAGRITNYEPGSTQVTTEYLLNTYERNVQIAELPCYCAPLFFEVIQKSMPVGVSVSIHPHEAQHNEIRYIPDFELLALKDQLQEVMNIDANKK